MALVACRHVSRCPVVGRLLARCEGGHLAQVSDALFVAQDLSVSQVHSLLTSLTGSLIRFTLCRIVYYLIPIEQ